MAILISLGVLLAGYQNCGSSFETHELLSSSGTNPSGVNNNEFTDHDFVCRSSAPLPEASLSRLLQSQLENTIHSLLSKGLPSAQVDEAFTQITGNAFVPADTGATFSETDNSISTAHVASYFYIADQFSSYVSKTPEQANGFLTAFIQLGPSTCTLDASHVSEACFKAFVENFVLRAYRRPIRTDVTHNELSDFLLMFQSADIAKSVSNAVFRALLSANFMTHLHNREIDIGNNQYQLSSYALVSKISYALTNDLPSEDGFKLAAQYASAPDQVIQPYLNMVFSDNLLAVREKMKGFYKQWLNIDHLSLHAGTQANIDVLFPGLIVDDGLKSAMQKEVVDFFDYVFASSGNFNSIFMDNVAMTDHPGLMQVYNQSEPVTSVDALLNGAVPRLNPQERAGVLTRSAFLAHSTLEKNHIRRGVGLMHQFLCQELPDPDDLGIDTTISAPAEIVTSREKVHISTSASACIGCHSIINPYGFAFSNYNTFGGYEPLENVIDESGNFTRQSLPIDSAVSLPAQSGIDGHVNDAIELSQSIAESGVAKACLSKQFFRFSMQRYEDESGDGCHLQSLKTSLDKGQSLQSFVQTLFVSESFQKMRKTP